MHRFIHVGHGYTRPASERQPVQLRVPVYVDDTGYVQNAGFVFDPITKLENSSLQGPVAIVMHRTAGSTAKSALAAYRASGLGTHFTVDKDGTIFQTASLKRYTRHVGLIAPRCLDEQSCQPGEAARLKALSYRAKHDSERKKSYPARYPMNEDSVGIEVVAQYFAAEARWEAPTEAQKKSISQLIGVLFKEFKVTSADVYEHDKISYKTAGEGAGLYGGVDSLPVQLPVPPF